MSHWSEPPQGRHAVRRRRRGLFRRPEPSPEERAYREARRRAHARIGFYAHLIPYLGVCLALAVVAGPRVGLTVALFWGIGVFFHWFGAVQGPGLRRRLIEREVGRELAQSAPRARRDLEDRHTRSLEQLSASIAHEIRNPITAAKSLVQQMGEDPASPESVDYAKVALEELDRVERSISHLLRFAREEEIRIEELRPVDVVESALETFRDRIARRGVRVERELASDARIRGDAEKLRRVVINLVGNALDALEGSQTREPTLRLEAGENLAGSEVWLRLRDNGPGMDEVALAQIWSPFYTSKASGTGLGLAICRKLVEAHGGSIEAQSTPGEGTEFVLSFPSAGKG